MAESFVGINEPTSANIDKRVETHTVTSSAGTTVHREVGVIGSASSHSAVAAVVASAPSSEYGLVVRNIPSGTQTVKQSTSSISVFGAVTANPASSAFTVQPSASSFSVWGAVTALPGASSFTVQPDTSAFTVQAVDLDVRDLIPSQDSVGVEGVVAHDASGTGVKPVLLGGLAVNVDDSLPAAVAANDLVRLIADQRGRLIITDGAPGVQPPKTAFLTSAGTTVLLAAPSAGSSIYVKAILTSNRSNHLTQLQFRAGAGSADSLVVTPADAGGGGQIIDFGPQGWKIGDNTALIVQNSACSVDVNILEWFIDAS